MKWHPIPSPIPGGDFLTFYKKDKWITGDNACLFPIHSGSDILVLVVRISYKGGNCIR